MLRAEEKVQAGKKPGACNFNSKYQWEKLPGKASAAEFAFGGGCCVSATSAAAAARTAGQLPVHTCFTFHQLL